MRPAPFAWILFLLSPVVSFGKTIEFDRDIRPILSDKCIYCHGPDEQHREADLRLDLQEDAFHVIVPGKPEQSELVARIRSKNDDIMPPIDSHKELSSAEIQLFTDWIQQGAEWQSL